VSEVIFPGQVPNEAAVRSKDKTVSVEEAISYFCRRRVLAGFVVNAV
jgi:hypothetical protein